jgi:hypothetical protein
MVIVLSFLMALCYFHVLFFNMHSWGILYFCHAFLDPCDFTYLDFVSLQIDSKSISVTSILPVTYQICLLREEKMLAGIVV